MTIVAAIDASPAARPVLERALEQAQLIGSRVHVLHVFQPPSTVYPVEGMYLTDDEQFERAEHDLVWKEVEDLIAGAPVDVEQVEERGYPATAIVGHGKEAGAELIVIGTRGRGGFASLVLGSTSQAVIHDAECDVLVVKTNGE